MNRAFTFVVYIRDTAQICWTTGDVFIFRNVENCADLQGFNTVWQRFPHRDKGVAAAAFCGIACASLTQCGWQPAIN